MKSRDAYFMKRCLDLARLGAPHTSPNPLVGAIVVHDNIIIGEGFHRRYGEAHAEVNAIRSISPENQHLLPYSTIYISLEPCAIYGHTPPCVNLILDKKIPRVVIAGLDRTPGVNGKGVKKLEEAGVIVVTDVLEQAGGRLNAIRNTFVTKRRPYVILKFAQSQNQKIANLDRRPVWFTNRISKRLVHKWRSEVDAIMIGRKTAQFDNPRLNNRLHFGPSPIRVVLDQHLRLSRQLHLFDGQHQTIVFADKRHRLPPPAPNLSFVGIPFDQNTIDECLSFLHSQNISTLLVEGGAQLLNSFIENNTWDEARVLTGNKWLPTGIDAPILPVPPVYEKPILDDKLQLFYNE